jgi:hemerythrin-like domain-containing protein
LIPHSGPVEQMLYEHSIGRDCLQGLRKAIAQKNTASALKNGHGWIEMIRPHIDVENHILYPLAEDGLCDFDKEEIGKLYAAADLEKGMLELRERYGKIEKELRARYLAY